MKLKEDLLRTEFIMTNFSSEKEESNNCSICSINFSTQEALKNHAITTHSATIFKCKFCPDEFLEGFKLTRHYRKVHKKNPGEIDKTSGIAKKFHCFYCEPVKSFTRKDSAIRHFKAVHKRSDEEIKTDIGDVDIRNFGCARCEARFRHDSA